MQCTKSMHQKYAKTLKQKVEIYANFPTEKFLSKVMVEAGSFFDPLKCVEEVIGVARIGCPRN